jgi:hypothetical protein
MVHRDPVRAEFWSRIQAILMTEWDPIGVKDEPVVADEYDGYIPGVWKLLSHSPSVEAIMKHLDDIAVERMGFTSHLESNRVAAVSLHELHVPQS